MPWLSGSGISFPLWISGFCFRLFQVGCKTFVVFQCRSQYLAHNLATVKTQTEFGNRSKIIVDLLFQFIEVFLFLVSRHLVCPKHTKINHIA